MFNILSEMNTINGSYGVMKRLKSYQVNFIYLGEFRF